MKKRAGAGKKRHALTVASVLEKLRAPMRCAEETERLIILSKWAASE